jgi:hypothetical protein
MQRPDDLDSVGIIALAAFVTPLHPPLNLSISIE